MCIRDRSSEADLALKQRLLAAYGRWEASEGTPYHPEAWFRILADALHAEAATPEDAAALAGFALAERLPDPTPKAREALADPEARAVLERFAETVTGPALRTPESANGYLQELRHHFRDTAGLRGHRSYYRGGSNIQTGLGIGSNQSQHFPAGNFHSGQLEQSPTSGWQSGQSGTGKRVKGNGG